MADAAGAANYPISNCLISFDGVADYIPILSTVTNGLMIITKIALDIFACCFSATYKEIENSPLIRHINQKSYIECVFVAIPIINLLVSCVRDDMAAHNLRAEALQKARNNNPREQPDQEAYRDRNLSPWEKKLKRETEAAMAKAKQEADEKHFKKWEGDLFSLFTQVSIYIKDPKGLTEKINSEDDSGIFPLIATYTDLYNGQPEGLDAPLDHVTLKLSTLLANLYPDLDSPPEFLSNNPGDIEARKVLLIEWETRLEENRKKNESNVQEQDQKQRQENRVKGDQAVDEELDGPLIIRGPFRISEW